MIWLMIAGYFVIGFISGRLAFSDVLGDSERYNDYRSDDEWGFTKEYKDALFAFWGLFFFWLVAIPVGVFIRLAFRDTKIEKEKARILAAKTERKKLEAMERDILTYDK